MIRCRLIARGRVQGVNYRYFVKRCAESVGVHGYVKNLEDGTVEIVAEAEGEEQMERFKQLAARKGADDPWGPHVEALVVKDEQETAEPSYSSFEIAY